MNLLIDVGNSRLKWAYAEGQQFISSGAVAHTQVLPQDAITIWQAGPKPARIVAASVAANHFCKSLSAWCQQQWGVEVEYSAVQAHSYGIDIAYSQPQQLGVDRWLAMIAAHHLVEGALCVVDCGTAVTIDVLSAKGRHQGGIILPGLTMMRSSLMQQTNGLKQGDDIVKPMKINSLLGHDTQSGVEIGVRSAIVGAIENLIGEGKLQSSASLCVITGGDADTIMAGLSSECCHVPDLVLRGLQLITSGEIK